MYPCITFISVVHTHWYDSTSHITINGPIWNCSSWCASRSCAYTKNAPHRICPPRTIHNTDQGSTSTILGFLSWPVPAISIVKTNIPTKICCLTVKITDLIGNITCPINNLNIKTVFGIQYQRFPVFHIKEIS